MSAAMATIIAAAVAAVVSLATAAITGRRETRHYRNDFIERQLNELYAPILLLLKQDDELQRQVKAGLPEGAHLLDNMDAIIADESRHRIANQIVAVNEKIVRILEGKAGLSQGPLPPAFAHFVGHHYMLERAVAGEPAIKDAPFQYFPRQFEKDIEDGYASLRRDINKRLLPWYRRKEHK